MTLQTNGHSSPSLSSLSGKQRALRDLNARKRTVLVALNQAQAAINHAAKAVEQDYQHDRMQIINSAAEDHQEELRT